MNKQVQQRNVRMVEELSFGERGYVDIKTANQVISNQAYQNNSFLLILIHEQEKLQEEIKQLNKNLLSLPEGKLLCAKNGTGRKWYKSNGATPIYIPKKQDELVQGLALRKYYELQIEELTFLYNKATYLINKILEHPQKSIHFFDEDSPYRDLLFPYFESQTPYMEWAKAKYNSNPYFPEKLTQKCSAKHLVRSKSEQLIANALFTNKIPYRYECELILGEEVIYPDFTVCHPRTGEIRYWEHCGMMDDPNYRNRLYEKLKLYGDYGYIPSINLILTYETAEHPLDSEQIEQVIYDYFIK